MPLPFDAPNEEPLFTSFRRHAKNHEEGYSPPQFFTTQHERGGLNTSSFVFDEVRRKREGSSPLRLFSNRLDTNGEVSTTHEGDARPSLIQMSRRRGRSVVGLFFGFWVFFFYFDFLIEGRNAQEEVDEGHPDDEVDVG